MTLSISLPMPAPWRPSGGTLALETGGGGILVEIGGKAVSNVAEMDAWLSLLTLPSIYGGAPRD